MAAKESPQLRTVYGATVDDCTEVDAGIWIVAGQAGRMLTVVDGWIRSTGAADTCTSIDISDATTTAIAWGQAGLTDGTIFRAGDTNSTVTNLGTTLAEGKGLRIKTTGSAIGTATAMEWCVHYIVTGMATGA